MTPTARRLAGHLIAAGVRLTERGGRTVTYQKIPGRQSRTRVLGQQEQDGVVFVRLHSLQHSLWRSVELNAALARREHLRAPLLDLGCGNGRFLSLLLSRAQAGVDLDWVTLSDRSDGLYTCVAVADASNGLPFANNYFASIFSNSVIEHVTPIHGLLDEVARTLRPGGLFLFTVPSDRFLVYLSEAFGLRDAQRLNEQMNHVHLLSPQEWMRLLAAHGLATAEWQYYFPAQAVFWWRLLATRFFMRLERSLGEPLWHLLRGRLVCLTRASAQPLAEGAGLLVIARKGGHGT